MKKKDLNQKYQYRLHFPSNLLYLIKDAGEERKMKKRRQNRSRRKHAGGSRPFPRLISEGKSRQVKALQGRHGSVTQMGKLRRYFFLGVHLHY